MRNACKGKGGDFKKSNSVLSKQFKRNKQKKRSNIGTKIN